MALLGRALVMCVALLATACSHTFFQFHIDGRQQNAIIAAQQGLAATQGDPGALSQVVDLNGRRAVETLLAGMTLEQTEGDEQFQRLSRALYMGVMANGEDPLAAINMDTLTIASRF